MPALCQSYETADEAHRAVAALRDSGMPPDRVHVLMGAEMHDALREAAGTFAAERSPDAVVGAFAGDRPAASVRGSFAPGGAAGPERSFGAADRDVVVTYA